MDLADLRQPLARLVEEAGSMAQGMRGDLDPQVKPDASVVTRADFAVESWLRSELLGLIPGSAVWGEEEGFAPPTDAGLWLVDPVDGTSNFAVGSPLWGVSIAWMHAGRIRAGAVALPDLGEVYMAIDGMGATVNGALLPGVAPGPILAHDLVSCSPNLLRQADFRAPGNVRYVGSFVVEGAFFARGRFRALLTSRPALYDVAACVCLAREVGAEVRHLDGSTFEEAAQARPGKVDPPFGFFPPACPWTA